MSIMSIIIIKLVWKKCIFCFVVLVISALKISDCIWEEWSNYFNSSIGNFVLFAFFFFFVFFLLLLLKYDLLWSFSNAKQLCIVKIGFRTYEYWKFPCGSMSAFCSTIVAKASGLSKLAGAAAATAKTKANTTRNFILIFACLHLWLVEELDGYDNIRWATTDFYIQNKKEIKWDWNENFKDKRKRDDALSFNAMTL